MQLTRRQFLGSAAAACLVPRAWAQSEKGGLTPPRIIHYNNFASHLLCAFNPNMYYPELPYRWSDEDWRRLVDMIANFGFNVFEFCFDPLDVFDPVAPGFRCRRPGGILRRNGTLCGGTCQPALRELRRLGEADLRRGVSCREVSTTFRHENQCPPEREARAGKATATAAGNPGPAARRVAASECGRGGGRLPQRHTPALTRPKAFCQPAAMNLAEKQALLAGMKSHGRRIP